MNESVDVAGKAGSSRFNHGNGCWALPSDFWFGTTRYITPVEDLLASVVGVLLCLMLSQQSPSESGIDVGLADGCGSLLLELEFMHHLIAGCERHEIFIHEVAWQSWDIAKCPLGG